MDHNAKDDQQHPGNDGHSNSSDEALGSQPSVETGENGPTEALREDALGRGNQTKLSTPLTTEPQGNADNWSDPPAETLDMLVERVRRDAYSADGAVTQGERAVDLATRPFIRGVLEFVERFEVEPGVTDWPALNKSLDDNNVPKHGNTKNEWHRVVAFFRTEETSRAMVAKRAKVLAGIRIKKIRSDEVLTAFEEKENFGRVEVGGVGRFVKLYGTSQTKEQRPEPELDEGAVARDEPAVANAQGELGDAETDDARQLIPSLQAQIDRRAVRIQMGNRVLPAMRLERSGSVLTIVVADGEPAA